MKYSKWAVIGAVVLLIAAVGAAALVLTRGGSDDGHFNVYFFNPVAMRMESEARPLPTGDRPLHAVIGHLHSGPRASNLDTTWPLELAPLPENLINVVVMDEMTLIAFILPVFNEMAPLNQSLFMAALIHTFQGLPLVSDIRLYVTDAFSAEPVAVYDNNHAGVLLEPLDPPISPRWIADFMFTNLHFVDATGTGLVTETYFAQNIDRWPVPLAISTLQLLIDGPRYEGAVGLIPPETRILDLAIDGADIYVNLSNDFVTRFVGDKELADLMIHSIVNTLLAEGRTTARLSRLYFLIETQQVENFHGVEDFHTYFERDETLLLSYIEAREAEYATWDEIE